MSQPTQLTELGATSTHNHIQDAIHNGMNGVNTIKQLQSDANTPIVKSEHMIGHNDTVADTVPVHDNVTIQTPNGILEHISVKTDVNSVDQQITNDTNNSDTAMKSEPLTIQQLTLTDLPPRCRMHTASMSICMPWCYKRWRECNSVVPPTEAFNEIRKLLYKSTYSVNQPSTYTIPPYKPVDVSQWHKPAETLDAQHIGVLKQCTTCQKRRYVPVTHDHVQSLESNTTWTCTQHTEPTRQSCGIPEEIFPSKLIALENYRVSGIWNYSVLGIAPFSDDTYNAVYTHSEWTKYETITLLELIRDIGTNKWDDIANNRILKARHTLQSCQTRFIHILSMAALYCQTVTRKGLSVVKNVTTQQLQSSTQQRTSTRTPVARTTQLKQSTNAINTPAQPRKVGRQQTRDKDDFTPSSHAAQTAARLSGRALSRAATQKRVKYTYDESDDDFIDDTRASTPEPEFQGKIERILAQRTRKQKVDAFGRFIEDTDQHIVDDAIKGPSHIHRHGSTGSTNSPNMSAVKPPTATTDNTDTDMQLTTTADTSVPNKDTVAADDIFAEDAEIVDIDEYLVKWENRSYLHLNWYNEKQMHETFGSVNTLSKLQAWRRERSRIEARNLDQFGGGHFDPKYIQVDRIINARQVMDPVTQQPIEEYLVKWQGLSYLQCTWETGSDIKDEMKIAIYKRFNRQPLPRKPTYTTDEFNARRNRWYIQSPTYKSQHTLRDYQVIGVNWLIAQWHSNRNCILADEMGLGKTVQVTAFLEHLRRVEGNNGPYLVIVPLSTLNNWKREVEGWTDMNAVVYHDTENGKVSRQFIRQHEFFYTNSRIVKFNILITSYEVVIADTSELAHIPWQYLIIDEGHRIKNRAGKLLDALKEFKCNRKLLMTGTPIQNNTAELFSLLNFLEPQQFADEYQFQAQFGELDSNEQVQQLQALLRPYLLRRLKETVEKSLPDKEETIIDIELTTMQKKYYRAIYERNVQWLKQGVSKNAMPKLLNVEMELRKCCNHPWLLDYCEDREVPKNCTDQQYFDLTIHASGKFVLLDKLLPKLFAEKHKVLIFSQMNMILDILAEYCSYKQYAFERLDGSVSGNERSAAIDRFSQPESNRFIFLLSTRAGGVGLNLAAADTVIIFDSDWNPQMDLQAQARAHRIGQTNKVMIYRLVTRNTYEAEMFVRASKKLGIDQAVLTNLTHGAKAIADDDRANIDKLLKLGAYGSMNDDDSAAKKFSESNIDDILANYSHVVQTSAVTNNENSDVTDEHSEEVSNVPAGIKFSKMTFTSDASDMQLDINDPLFWQKFIKSEDDDSNPDILLTQLTDGTALQDTDKFVQNVKKCVDRTIKARSTGEVTELDSVVNLLIQFCASSGFEPEHIEQAQEWLVECEKRERRSRVRAAAEEQAELQRKQQRGRGRRRRDSSDELEDDSDAGDRSDDGEASNLYDRTARKMLGLTKNKRHRTPSRTRTTGNIGMPDNVCSVCYRTGRLLGCDGVCARYFHLQCVELQDDPDPNTDWLCNDCTEQIAECIVCHNKSPYAQQTNTAAQLHDPENTVHRCAVAWCGVHVHIHCAEQRKMKVDTELNFVRCHHHYCQYCNQGKRNASTLIYCETCDTSCHLSCFKDNCIRLTKKTMICDQCYETQSNTEIGKAAIEHAGTERQLPYVRPVRTRRKTLFKQAIDKRVKRYTVTFKDENEVVYRTTERIELAINTRNHICKGYRSFEQREQFLLNQANGIRRRQTKRKNPDGSSAVVDELELSGLSGSDNDSVYSTDKRRRNTSRRRAKSKPLSKIVDNDDTSSVADIRDYMHQDVDDIQSATDIDENMESPQKRPAAATISDSGNRIKVSKNKPVSKTDELEAQQYMDIQPVPNNIDEDEFQVESGQSDMNDDSGDDYSE